LAKTKKRTPELNLEVELIDLYLSVIHDKPHTLFNPNLLRKRLRDGTLPEAVIYSIMALAARYITQNTLDSSDLADMVLGQLF
jgi:hypothetical protein